MNRNIFIDTSAFIAIRVSDDKNNHNALLFLEEIKTKKLILHTTNFILDEVYTYFCTYHDIAVEMAQLIMNNPLIILHRISVEDEKKAWEILIKYKDKTFSYTDATSFAVMERLHLDSVFAYDIHFSQFGSFTIKGK